MKIGILSRDPRVYSTRRLRQAARDRGHEVRVLDTLRCAIYLEKEHPRLTYRGKYLSNLDGVIPRIGASITLYGTAVVRQFEQMGVFCLNSSLGITYSRDKLRSLQILTRHDVGMPPTAFVRSREDVIPAIERVGGVPVVIKVLEGTQGVGVILADSLKVAESIVETLQLARQNVLIQKFVAESGGRDIRAFVVGDRVVAAMRRTAKEHEFRSNVHRGGATESVTLDHEYEHAAIRSAQIMGLRVAGVDLLEANSGPQVMEVNSSPGLEGIERATGVDVAGAIIEYMEERVLFPDFDLRQRLALSRGYAVAEVPVAPKSMLAGRTLADVDLRAMDVTVLTIKRGREVIPNPYADRVMEAGDVLLCFGRTDTLRTLIPPPRRRKRPKRAGVPPAATGGTIEAPPDAPPASDVNGPDDPQGPPQ